MAIKKSKGTLLKLSISAVFTTIAQIRSISGPGISIDQIDATVLESIWRRFVSSIPDGGEVSFELLFDPSDSTLQALTDVIGLDDESWEIHWAGSATAKWAFTGNVSGISPEVTEGDLIKCNVSVKVSNSMTLPT